MVTGLTIPDKALIIVSFDLLQEKSGENGNVGSNATCAVILQIQVILQ